MRRRLRHLVVAVAAVSAARDAPPRRAPRQRLRRAIPCRRLRTSAARCPRRSEVLGFPLGSREVTAAETNAYVDAVDAASDRVVSGTFGTSWQGRQLRYTLVGDPENVTPGRARRRPGGGEQAAGSRDVRRGRRSGWRVRRPSCSGSWGTSTATRRARPTPSCASSTSSPTATTARRQQILDNAVVGIIPTQNPDGREAETRQNFYGFDMNRDWFARTQRETDTKLELLRRYPGMLYVDGHEMGANHYFFPPTADPTYHEITSQSMSWQDFLYGDALAAEFKRQHISFFTNKVFDFFAMVYGDTVPGDRVQRCRDDVREGELRPHRPADVRALRHALGLDLPGRAEPRGHPPRLALRPGWRRSGRDSPASSSRTR